MLVRFIGRKAPAVPYIIGSITAVYYLSTGPTMGHGHLCGGQCLDMGNFGHGMAMCCDRP